MSDEQKPVPPMGAAGQMSVNENRIWLLRKKADGKTYRIYKDGREELDPEANKET